MLEVLPAHRFAGQAGSVAPQSVVGDVMQLAHMPDFVWGILDVRGEAVPVVDLRARFGLPHSDESFSLGPSHQVAIVLDWATAQGQRVIAVLVDSVQDVVFLQDTALKPLPDVPFKQATPYLSGLVHSGGEWLMRLDMQKLLSPEELAQAAAVAPSRDTARA
jgi:purine-binding chemotaxis protein CheW